MKKENREVINRHKIESVKDVITLIDNYPELSWQILQRRIENIISQMNRANVEGRRVQIYSPKDYSHESLLYTDKLNTGKELLLHNPTIQYQTQFSALEEFNISEIKRYLTHTTSTGKNYLLMCARNIVEERVLQILSAIEMYEDQIERQALLTQERNINLFTYNYVEKRKIVEDNLGSIVEYLIANTRKKLVWGNFTDVQKKLLMSSLVNKKSIDLTIKERLIDIISNYTTLPELEELFNNNQKVLKRFIVR